MKERSRIYSLFTALAILAAIVALLVILKNCADKHTTEKMIKEFNEHADLPISLAVLEEEFGDISAYEYIGGFGCYRLEKADISYEISGFPDVLDDYRTTAISFTSSAYSVYGIRVGNSYSAETAEIMEVFDFKEVSSSSNDRFITFENNELSIHFTLENGIITEISARLESTNKYNVIF